MMDCPETPGQSVIDGPHFGKKNLCQLNQHNASTIYTAEI